MAPSLLSLSIEALHNITTFASDPLGPPCEWYNLTLCCRALRRKLDVNAMHSLLFSKKFQVPANACHLLSTHARGELERRFIALKLFRRGVECFSDDDAFTDALWVAYVMLKAEELRQMNVDQLISAGLPGLLLLYLQRHLGAPQNGGWPIVSERNSLVIALLWLLSSAESISSESTATREEVMERIRPYVLAAFRYPLSSTMCSPKTATRSMPECPANNESSEGPIAREVHYFGKRIVHIPAVPIYSILCYFTRLDMLNPMFPVHISRTHPPPKGPRREDVEHFINECRTPFEPWDVEPNSRSPAAVRNAAEDALSRSLNQHHFPGLLTGRWKGSSIVPGINDYRHWMDQPEAPETMETFCRQPLYLTLQEHFCYDATLLDDPVALPETWVEHDDGVRVDGWSRFYETHRGDDPPEREIFDILVTGQTDDPYASAWGHFKIIGRVRLSDGLIVLRRESVAGLGTTVLRGYMSARQNFCGRYRAEDDGCSTAEWEAAFSLCKMSD
ncbi:hypothetical protein C8F01DRAFT_483054 [Mycena amicta]|nr:hypothetical protein C8F01DRAFT_483054 [Mycena amicta]